MADAANPRPEDQLGLKAAVITLIRHGSNLGICLQQRGLSAAAGILAVALADMTSSRTQDLREFRHGWWYDPSSPVDPC